MLLSPSGRGLTVLGRSHLRLNLTVKASFESFRTNRSTSRQNISLIKSPKTKKYNKRPEESLRKRKKTPRGPYVFTRGVLNQCDESNGFEVIKTVEELGLDGHIPNIDFEVSSIVESEQNHAN